MNVCGAFLHTMKGNSDQGQKLTRACGKKSGNKISPKYLNVEGLKDISSGFMRYLNITF